MPTTPIPGGLVTTSASAPAVLDDIEDAVSRLSDFGKEVVGPAARAVREQVILLAAVNRWPVIHHHAYVKWIVEHADRGLQWISLDPLFPEDHLIFPALRVRLTRTATAVGWQISADLPEEVARAVKGKAVGIIDDVAFSGGTVRHVANLVSRAGGTVDQVIFAASTARAKCESAEALAGAQWVQFHRGDVSAIHLRDSCQCLPYAGRRSSTRSNIDTPTGLVDVRVPPTAFRGGLWELLCAHPSVQHTWSVSRQQLVERFSLALGRPATVADIALLGDAVTIMLPSHQSVVSDTELGSLW